MYQIHQQAFSLRFLTASLLLLLGLLIGGGSSSPAFAADLGLTDPAAGTAGIPTGISPDTTTSNATAGDGTTSGTGSGDGTADEWNTDVINSPLRMDGGFVWQALRDLFSFESLHRSASSD